MHGQSPDGETVVVVCEKVRVREARRQDVEELLGGDVLGRLTGRVGGHDRHAGTDHDLTEGVDAVDAAGVDHRKHLVPVRTPLVDL